MGLINSTDRQHHNGNVRDATVNAGHSADATVQPHLDAVRALRPSGYKGQHRKA